MTEYYINDKYSNSEKTIAKLFVFSFPFKMVAPLQFLDSWTFGLAGECSFFFCIIGLFLIFMRGKLTLINCEGTRVLKRFFAMYVICDIASLIMAFFLHDEVGTIAGEGTYIAVIKKIFFSFAYIIFVYYGREVWKILSKEEVAAVFHKTINVCIIVAMLQILIVFGVSPAISIYDLINTAFKAWSSGGIIRTGRIALLTNEPAYGSSYMVAFVIPFLLAEILSGKNKGKNVFKTLACTVAVYFTKSTTGYILVAVEMIVFCVVYLRESPQYFASKIVLLICVSLFAGLVVIMLLSQTSLSGTIFSVFDKLFSQDNATSADRKAMVSVNLQILLHYPILGVGNGNQGFFYQRFFPEWAHSAYTAQSAYLKAGTILYDGGPFWLAFISGYGILGIVLFVNMLKSSIQLLRRYRDKIGYLLYFYLISVSMLIISGISRTLGSACYMWFIFAFPMAMDFDLYEKNES